MTELIISHPELMRIILKNDDPQDDRHPWVIFCSWLEDQDADISRDGDAWRVDFPNPGIQMLFKLTWLGE